MNKKNGFTLVELLIVMSIIVILATMMIGIFNAIGVTNKGRDAQRKKDLNRIKTAFEEYFNDKGEYPQDVSTWNIKENCGSISVFSPYLNLWPCDPSGEPYTIIIEPNKFRILANLENKKDKDIPDYWYERTDLNVVGFTRDNINYGVSSSNILWYESYAPSYCDTSSCYKKNLDTMDGCKQVDEKGCNYDKDGTNCYYRDNGSCTDRCRTTCCGSGCGY